MNKTQKLVLTFFLFVVALIAVSPYVRISTSEAFGLSVRTSQDAKFQTLFNP